MAVPMFMIISGYVYSFSYRRNTIESIGMSYYPKNIINKFIRYTVPFVIVFVIEEILWIHADLGGTAYTCIMGFLQGGWGQGSYYYPVMIQFIFVYPIIYFIIKKHNFIGVIICGVINAIYELLQCAYGMNESCYRLLMCRYILLIAVGCYIASEEYVFRKKLSVILFCIGFLFITSIYYWGYTPKIISYWTGTSFIASFYIIPIAMILLSRVRNVRLKLLEIIGKASYHIFLAQMVWYIFGTGFISIYIANRLSQIVCNIIVCLILGVVFYYIETPINKYINKKVSSLVK